MRALVLLLVGLAGLKIWAQDHIYRSAAEDALVHAYRERAIDACQKDRPDRPSPADRRKEAKASLVTANAVASAFANPASVHLVIGKRDVDVAIWDVDNPLWAVRYKYPLLVLQPAANGAAAATTGLVCEFDVTLGTATVQKPRS